MFISIIISYLPYVLVTAFTPGPNNIIALYAIGHDGWRRGQRTIWGLGVGFFAVMMLCGVFCYEIALFLPKVLGVLKYVGAAYVFWLGISIMKSKPHDEKSQKTSFGKGVLLQFVNIKIIMCAVTAYSGYVLPFSREILPLLAHGLCFTLIGMAGMITWGFAGAILKNFIAKHQRAFNLVMGGTLLVCAVTLL